MEAWREELYHSAKGTEWKNHKYLKKEGNRYYYDVQGSVEVKKRDKQASDPEFEEFVATNKGSTSALTMEDYERWKEKKRIDEEKSRRRKESFDHALEIGKEFISTIFWLPKLKR